jgi:hypothetical protein
MLNRVKLAIPLGLGIVSALALHQIAMIDHGIAHAAVSTSQQARMRQIIAENGPVLSQTAADPQRIMPPLLFR